MSAQLSDRLRDRLRERLRTCTPEQARIVAVLSMQFVLGLAHVPGDARQHCANVLALLEDPGTTPEQFQVAANAAHYAAARAAACAYAANSAAYAAARAAACAYVHANSAAYYDADNAAAAYAAARAAARAAACAYVHANSAAYADNAAHNASKTASECDKPALEKFIAQLMLVAG